jgi:Tol biopolymer transport system component
MKKDPSAVRAPGLSASACRRAYDLPFRATAHALVLAAASVFPLGAASGSAAMAPETVGAPPLAGGPAEPGPHASTVPPTPPAPPAVDTVKDGSRPATAPRDLPLEPARTVEFTTREGTWISLDLTPDGRTLVFELLCDLYVLSVEGGRATRITEGMACDTQPRISPEGEHVAFISDRDGADNLWIARLDGSDARKLTSEKQQDLVSPAWTPDGQYVLVTRMGRELELRLHHIHGGSGITLRAEGGGAGAGSGGPGGGPGGGAVPAGLGGTFSPDGRYLYYTVRLGGPGATFPRHQIARRDMVTGNVDVITQAEWGAIRPVISPDGRWLVYGTRHETETGLRVRDLRTGADRWLIWPIQRDEQEGRPTRDLLPGYTFTPDGREIITTFDGRIQAVEVETGRARVIPFEADVALDIGPELRAPWRVEEGPVRARLVQSPRLSPDGDHVAFSVLAKVYAMALPDGTPRRLTRGDDWEFQPAWSPDGRWIAYVTWGVDGGHIWRMRADGRGQPQRLTSEPAFYTDLAFSPDGARVAALRGNAFMRTQTFSEFGGLRIPVDVVWLPAEGGEVRLVVPGGRFRNPHFAGGAERIHLYSRDGLVSMRLDGTDRRTHLRVTGRPNPRAPEPPPADAVLMRPGGGWALARSANQLYVVAVPPTGGEAPTVSVSGGGVPVKRITDVGSDYFGWSDDGRTIYWAIGSTVFRRPFDSIDFRAEPESGPEDPDAESVEEGAEPAGEPEDGTPADPAGADGSPDAPDATEPAGAGREGTPPLDEHEAVERTEVVLEFPRATPRGAIVLRGGTVITMEGDEVVQDADVVVVDHRIRAVGARGTVEIPAGARELDVTGRTVVPGFIDTHAHWEFRTHDVLEPHNWSLLANLAYGVTTGLEVQTSTNDYLAYQDLVETGLSVGQRAFMTGPGVFSSNEFRSYEEVEAFLRRYREHYRTHNIKSYLPGNRQQRQWVVQASQKLGLMPTTEGGSNLVMNLTQAIDGFHGHEHTLPVTPLYDDVVQLFARTRTAYTPTLLVLYGGPSAREWFFTKEDVHEDPKLNRFYPQNHLAELTRRRGRWVRDDEHNFQAAAEQAARIQRAGGLVGVGGHGELQGLGYHWEMWALAMGGMTPREVLRAATIDGARIIGVEADLGSIAPGKLADLVVLDANPLDDIRNTNTVHYVMKNGELYEGDTLTRIWPDRRPLPPLWWWGGGPADRRAGGER